MRVEVRALEFPASNPSKKAFIDPFLPPGRSHAVTFECRALLEAIVTYCTFSLQTVFVWNEEEKKNLSCNEGRRVQISLLQTQTHKRCGKTPAGCGKKVQFKTVQMISKATSPQLRISCELQDEWRESGFEWSTEKEGDAKSLDGMRSFRNRARLNLV